MKKILLSAILHFLFLTWHVNAQTMTFSVSEWPPFLSESIKNNGLFSLIISRSLALEGYKISFKYYPFKRGYNLAQKGVVDGSLGYYYTKERAQLFVFSDPVLVTQEVFFHLKSTQFDWKDFNDLKKYHIGGPSGYAITKFIMGKGVKVDTAIKEVLVLKKLVGKRNDAINLELNVGHYLIKNTLTKEEAEKITYHPKAIYEKPVHVIFGKSSKNHQENMEILNRGLKRLKKSGEYNQIITTFRKGGYLN